jgi:orotate phosphoribosyltransferase
MLVGKAFWEIVKQFEGPIHGVGGQWLEGRKNLPPGSRVVIVEDVTTTGGSSMKAVERAQQEGLEVLGIITLVDRQEGAQENIEGQGQNLTAVFTREQVVG